MTIYTLLYIAVIIVSILIGFSVYNKYKNNEGKYFIIMIIMISIWLFLYLLSFSTTYDKDILLIYSQIMYPVSLIGMYGLLFFIMDFGNGKSRRSNIIFNMYIFISAVLLFTSIFTSYIISDMLYDISKNIYYEVFGNLYFIFVILYMLFIPLFGLVYFYKIRNINNILNKIRIRILFYGFLLFIFCIILFLVLLPLLGIRIFEKEIILFFIPFIFSVWYVTYKYNFLDIKLLLGKIINFVFSISISIFCVTIGRYYLTNVLDNRLVGFWGISSEFGIIDLLLGVTIFIIIHSLFKNIILGELGYIQLTKQISKIKKKIAFISTLYSLNKYLDGEFRNLIKSSYVNIKIISPKGNNLKGVNDYFTKDKSYSLFINDIVFIEENKNKFDYDLIKTEISKKTYLVFPLINNKGDFLGIFEIGYKTFKDTYTKEEVDIFKDFTEFLVGHIKYIEIYSEISDLNINLDKKVDEKTIEYNQLLNKQTEFISMASHEIKSPIGSSIFQIDFILDEIKEGTLSLKGVEKELKILNNTLLKVGDLTNKIFSVQKYDLDKIVLYKQNLNFHNYLKELVSLFGSINKGLKLKINLDSEIGFIDIDKIQFTQVIDNLLNNALKFSNKEKAKINFTMKGKGKNISIVIEDNGKGFNDSDSEIIFEKYNSENTTFAGIGLGLYLCKSIVEMHGGNISAENSKKLGGAKFIIIIPKIYND